MSPGSSPNTSPQLATIMIAVATLNNNAVVEIRHGNYMEAHRLLSTALMGTKQYLQLQREKTEQEDESMVCTGNAMRPSNHHTAINELCWFHDDGGASSREEGSDHHHAQEETSSPFSGYKKNYRCENDECYVFRSPLQVNVQSLQQGILGNQTAPALSSGNHNDGLAESLTFAIIYNLALVQHLSGHETLDQKMLHRAVVVYRQAAKFLSSSYDRQPPNLVQFYKLAIANNMGHAYNCLRCPEQVRQCFQELANTIVLYNRLLGSGTAAAGRLEPTYHQQRRPEVNAGFLSNAMLLFLVSNTAAAA